MGLLRVAEGLRVTAARSMLWDAVRDEMGDTRIYRL